MYQVSTKAFKQAVRRNRERFPNDFMFELSPAEASAMRSQFVNASKSNVRYQPLAFTELGVAMLSSVLKSKPAVQMNIAIMRTFVRLREMMARNKDFAAGIEKLEQGHHRTASVIEILVEDLDRLAGEVKRMKAIPPSSKRKFGFDL